MTFGCVDKLTVAQIDTDMARIVGRSEENQIAGPHISIFYGDALSDLFASRAGQVNLEQAVVYGFDKTRAIDTGAVIAAQTMLCTLPATVFGPDHVFNVSVGWGIVD